MLQLQRSICILFFKKKGQDGLHLAYSFDALKWEALKGNQSFITPKLGKQINERSLNNNRGRQ
jgi:hypothetical protein